MATTGVNLPIYPSFMPSVPDEIRQISPILYDYLQVLRLMLIRDGQGDIANAQIIVAAMNSGTSGTFAIASGGHIAVTSGIVISVSAT